MTIAGILKGEITEDELGSLESELIDINGYVYDLYKRGDKGIKKMSDDDFEAHGKRVKEIIKGVYDLNSDKVSALRAIVTNLKKLLNAGEEEEMIKNFSDIQTKNI